MILFLQCCFYSPLRKVQTPPSASFDMNFKKKKKNLKLYFPRVKSYIVTTTSSELIADLNMFVNERHLK